MSKKEQLEQCIKKCNDVFYVKHCFLQIGVERESVFKNH